MIRRSIALLLLCGPALHAASGPAYTFEVKPLLSDRCFRCHGMDAK